MAGNTLPFIDGARHATLRRTLAQAWAAQLRETPPDIDAHARRLWAACPARGQFDLLHDFATPLAVTVIGEVLGVPVAAREALQADARHFLYLFTAMPLALTLAIAPLPAGTTAGAAAHDAVRALEGSFTVRYFGVRGHESFEILRHENGWTIDCSLEPPSDDLLPSETDCKDQGQETG